MKTLCINVFILTAIFVTAGPVRAETSGEGTTLAARWKQLVRSDAGLCWMPLCGDGRLAVALAQISRFVVLAEDPSWKSVNIARQAARNAGFLGNRVLVDRADLGRAPFADNSLDLMVLANLDDKALPGVSAAELLRALAPHGQAVIGRRKDSSAGPLTRAALEAWLTTGKIAGAKVVADDTGLWATFDKPRPAGLDDWSHWFHGPDNNPLSTDTVLKWPYAVQWLALPYQAPQPDVTLVSDGRVFLFIGHGWGGAGLGGANREQTLANTLIARNAYNGQELWRRTLPVNYLVHRSCAVATPDTFYLLEGSGVLRIDPATGKERSRIPLPDGNSEGKWMALVGQTLLLLTGDPDPSFADLKNNNRYGTLGDYEHEIPWGFGRQIVAYDLTQSQTRWTHTEEKPVDSRLVGVWEGRLFAYAPGSRAVCLDIASGSELWSNAKSNFLALMDDPEGFKEAIINRTNAGALCTPDAVLFHRVGWKNLVALAPGDGQVLWSKAPGKSAKRWGQVHQLATDGKLYTNVGVFNPATGKPEPWVRFGTVCSRITGSPEAFFGQGGRVFDRESGKNASGQGLKVSCYESCIPADGMLFGPPHSCVCIVSHRGQIAFAPTGEKPPEIPTGKDPERLEKSANSETAAPLEMADEDWPTYRANGQRTGRSPVAVAENARILWSLPGTATATCPVSAGGLVFVGRMDGTVQAVDGRSGTVRWEYPTAGRILASPTVWEGRLYVGSGDGRVYCLEAATGRLLWRFHAGPQRRRIMVYGSLAETWPVDSGVVAAPQGDPAHPNRVLACFAAGISSLNGAHMWAVDARTGQPVWHSDGSIPDKQAAQDHTGLYAAGSLAVNRGQLWLAGGVWFGRACFDLADGKMQPPNFAGPPNRSPGAEVGIFAGRYVYAGGSVLYRGANERRTSGGQAIALLQLDDQGHALYPDCTILANSYITPAWDDKAMVVTTDGGETVTSLDAQRLLALLDDLPRKPLDPKVRPNYFPSISWDAPPGPGKPAMPKRPQQWDQKRRTYGLVLTANAVVLLAENPWKTRQPKPEERSWSVAALDRADGHQLWEVKLPGEPVLNGLGIDRDGRVIVALTAGGIVCVGPK